MSADEAEYEVRWEAVIALDDGSDEERSGTERVHAPSLEQARQLVERGVRDRFDARHRIVRTRVISRADEGEGDYVGGWSQSLHYPPGAPDVDTIQGWRRSGRTPAQMLAAMRDENPALTPLALMLALEQSFDLERGDLREIRGWCRGNIDAGALDAALEPRIDQKKPRWNRPFELREARRTGASVAALARADREHGGTVLAIMHLIRAFPGLGLREAKGIGCELGHKSDADLDAELEKAIAALPKR